MAAHRVPPLVHAKAAFSPLCRTAVPLVLALLALGTPHASAQFPNPFTSSSPAPVPSPAPSPDEAAAPFAGAEANCTAQIEAMEGACNAYFQGDSSNSSAVGACCASVLLANQYRCLCNYATTLEPAQVSALATRLCGVQASTLELPGNGTCTIAVASPSSSPSGPAPSPPSPSIPPGDTTGRVGDTPNSAAPRGSSTGLYLRAIAGVLLVHAARKVFN